MQYVEVTRYVEIPKLIEIPVRTFGEAPLREPPLTVPVVPVERSHSHNSWASNTLNFLMGGILVSFLLE